MFAMIKSHLQTFNIFASASTANNIYELQNERISTRIFILTLIVAIVIIFIYTSQVRITQTIDVKYPPYDQFQSLSLRYPQTLKCPCNNIAIPHESFIYLKSQFHQLCSSDFITQDWIDHIGSAADIYVSKDFSYTGHLLFGTLASFCYQANDTAMNMLITFNSTRFITAEALIENVFNEQTGAIIQNFQLSVELTYYQLYNLIQFFTESNALLSGLFSNVHYEYDISTGYPISTPAVYANNTCDCSITSSCIESLSLLDRRINQNSSLSFFSIPGLFTGCFFSNAIQQSSLECFYEKPCIAKIEEFLQAPLAFNKPILPLNSSIDTQFSTFSTIDQLLAKAMIEKWVSNVSHVRYFHLCEVSSCTYSFTTRFNIVYIVTTLIGLIGGLSKILRMILPRVVKFIRHRFVPAPTITDESSVGHRNLMERLHNLNYFSKPSSTSNELETKKQIIATRIFILLLIFSLIVLISYYSAERVVTLHQIESPTFDQFNDLQSEQHSNPSFSCPCSTLAMANEEIIQIHYTLHPVCSSDFVREQWLDHIKVTTFHVSTDFRLIASDLFHSFASFCRVSAHHIDNRLTSFNTSLFIANTVLSPEEFGVKVSETVNSFKSSTSRSFARNIVLISNISRSNGLMSTYETNFGFFLAGIYPSYSLFFYYAVYITKSENMDSYCFCFSSVSCRNPLSIWSSNSTNASRLLDIPGLFLDCFILDGIRSSTFSCLFNQSCVNLMSFWFNISNINAIDIDSLIYFYPNSTIDDIMHEIFVDQWNYSSSYRAFYEQCRPDRCTYTLIQYNSFWIILTTVFGLVGGLIKIFQVVIPRLVQGVYALYSRCRHRVHEETSSDPTSIQTTFSFRTIIDRLRQLNLFPTNNPVGVYEHEIQGQIIATRIFLIFLLLSVVILTIYSSQVQVLKTVTITNPTSDQYTSLYNSHSGTLTCPCKNIAIPQQIFLTLQPTFHQVCKSDFINPQWANGISYTALAQRNLHIRDFRFVGGAAFTAIASLCQLSFDIINDALLDFNRSSFVTTQIIPQTLLVKQGQALIDIFISTNENTFINSLQIVRDMTQANNLLSGFQTSLGIYTHVLNKTDIQFATISKIYNMSSSCTCYTDPTCVEPAGLFYSVIDTIPMYSIPGFFIGCYMFEAALKSNLASFCDQSWIDTFRDTIQFDYYNVIPFSTTALNASEVSQYNITTPINIMMQKMMTEPWQTYVNYSAYYEECHPIECKYTYVVEYDLIYIITTIIGLIGGLVTIFQFVIPRAVKLIRRWWFNRRHRTTIHVTPIEIPETSSN